MEHALKSGLDAALVAVFIGSSLHWATNALFGKLPRLASYTVGTLAVGLVFTGWAVRSSLRIDTEASCLVWWMIVVGVGLGVGAGYLLDWLGGLVRENWVLKRQVGDDLHG